MALDPEPNDGEPLECTWCGGEGVDECDDPMQCMDPACTGEMCTCTACDGRGYNQRIW